jgi:hypothetical protein
MFFVAEGANSAPDNISFLIFVERIKVIAPGSFTQPLCKTFLNCHLIVGPPPEVELKGIASIFFCCWEMS